MTVEFGASQDATHYWAAIVVDRDGEHDLMDGYTIGTPTQEDVQEHFRCSHSWTAGMMYLHDEDLEYVASVRPVVCERCDLRYGQGEPVNPLNIISFEAVKVVR